MRHAPSASALICAIAVTSVLAQAVAQPAYAGTPNRVRRRELVVGQAELQRVYPSCTFVGDVRVERGVQLAPGAQLIQTGSKPLYVLGETRLGATTRVVQRGDRPLVLLHAKTGKLDVNGNGVLARVDGQQARIADARGLRICSSTLDGVAVDGISSGKVARSRLANVALHGFSGRIRGCEINLSFLGGAAKVKRSTVTMGVVTGIGQIDESTIQGVVTGNREHPFVLRDATIAPMTAVAPPSYKVETSSKTAPGGVEITGQRVLAPGGQSAGEQSFTRPHGQPHFNLSAAGTNTQLQVNGVNLWDTMPAPGAPPL